MKKSITAKLFIITSVIFITFISAAMLIQSYYFSEFYLNRKMSSLRENLSSFNKQYLSVYSDSNKIYSLMVNFENANNAKLIILDANGNYFKSTSPITDKKDANKLDAVNTVIEAWRSDPDAFTSLKNSSSKSYIFNSKEYDIKNIVAASTVNTKDKDIEIIFAVSSFVPISEASLVIKEFYLYFLIGAILLILLLSFIYTNMISKPLVRMNKTAKKMSNLDFTEKCIEKREDEIGSLSKTLNFLSENLDNSLTQLRESNRKLKEDYEKERQLLKARKDFISSVSHDLKTPIALIEGYAEGLKDGIVDEEDKEYYLDVIMDESKNMSKLITDMIDLSHLESGFYSLDKESFFIDKLLLNILRKYSKNFEDKNITLEKNIIESISVYADSSRIEQVIKNLLNNAIYHAKDPNIIRVSLSLENDYCMIGIKNTGDEIEDNIKERIWDTFFRKDKSRCRQLQNAGLGLSIVKNIIDLHEGKYGFSNTGDGVLFYFMIKIENK
ncbi:MAG: HAMP domain-containing sensor histidine kinase [Clostridiaceae bacterium]